MADHEPATVPTIDKWVPEPVGRYSKWDDVVEQIMSQPGNEWARLARPDPWQSSFPAWFRKKYKDVELYVPPGGPSTGHGDGRRWMYMRRKPLAQSPLRRP